MTTLALLGFASLAVRPHIPEPRPNRIASEPGDFMRQAGTHQIEWRPLDTSAFAEARRLERPILLVIGNAWSATARRMDREVFTAQEVAKYLSTNFVCVRVDGTVAPAWLTGLLPLSRARVGVRPDFQMWVLNPNGELLSQINRRRSSQRFDRFNFHDDLVRARQLYATLLARREPSDLGRLHAQDAEAAISGSGEPLPDLGACVGRTVNELERKTGGYMSHGYFELRPSAYRLMLTMGKQADVQRVLEPALTSPIVDLLDGGFFIRARGPNWRPVELDKPALLNAEMALVLCWIANTAPDREFAELCRKLLRRTLSSLTGEFVSEKGFIRTARQGDEQGAFGRSARSSFSPRSLREAIEPSRRDWARENLGLRVETNPQMLPYLAGSRTLDDSTFYEIERALKAQRPGGGRFVGGSTMSVMGAVVARLFEVARIRNDKKLAAFAATLFDRLDSSRFDDQVRHDLLGTYESGEHLRDYLAYADAALQDYLASSRVVSLRRGAAVLARALAVFAGQTSGSFRSMVVQGPLPAYPESPEIVDNMSESATAALIRLCSSYGRLLLRTGDEDDLGLRFLRSAFASTALFADVAPELGHVAAGYACSAASVADDSFAICVGPKGQELADELFRLRPTRLVAAGYGPVRPGLQSRPPGVYVFKAGLPSGPMSVKQAAEAMPLAYSVERN